MGDFNEVRFRSDRFGSIFNSHGANVFNSFIFNAGLVEVDLGGSSFTWCHKNAKKMSKLDRFLMSDNLFQVYPHISAITLERFLSNHRPILLREHHLDYGPIPFRFFHYWCEIDGFKKLVEETWEDSPNNDGNAMLNLMGKFKFIKAKIRIWNKTNMATQKNTKENLKSELEAVEAEIDRGNGSEDIVLNRMILIKNLQDINKLNSMEMAQKSNVKWAVEGDENSSFFHGTINKKRNILAVRGIMSDGLWIDDPSLVKREFLKHFSCRFSKPASSRATLHSNFPNRLTSSQQTDLECEVSKDEIKRAVWDCGTDKSPGPDGFTFGFYRYFWYLIENDVYKAVSYFFLRGDIPKGCNSTFIVLIPKFSGANVVKDFRPISLIGSLYKIIAKVLANKLVVMLGSIVSEVQSAFVKDRQILDGPFILDELIQWCKWKRKQIIMFKADFEKAFDSVRWDFLDDLLIKFGFEEKWRKWINSCLHSSRGSIIINGSPTDEFQFHKGLKQGDPLSPLLFILVMESLHLSFCRVEEAGLFNGIQLKSSITISHLFYADDAVFVGQWHEKNINTLVHVLECFFRVSGLRINMSKSKLMGLNVENDKIKEVALKLGCLTFKPHFSYLGSIVGGAMSRIRAWDDLVSRVNLRLSKWKLKMLSIGVASKVCDHSFTSSFRRQPRGGIEQEQLMDLLALTNDIWLVPMEDRWSWNLTSSGVFSVSSVRRVIDDKILPDDIQKTRWVRLVPIKVNVLAWKVKSNSLPSRFNISRRGIPIDSLKCGTCDLGVETVSHSFFTCSLVRSLVDLIARWRNVSCVAIDTYAEWVLWIQDLRMPPKNKRMLEGVFYSMWWHATWVNWKNALASKEKGGLGISSFYALNGSLMFKWYSRFKSQDSSLWLRVIKALYGDSGNLNGNTIVRYNSCWLNIIKEGSSLAEKGINISNAICFKLGNSEKARFWEDRWLDGLTLKMCFPRLYALEICNDITVASKVCDHSFTSSLCRQPRGGIEQEQLMDLLALTNDIRLVPMEDRWSWNLTSSGMFSVSSVRRVIDDKILLDDIQKTRWVRLVPIKVNVLAWKVKSNLLPFRFNISRRGIPIDSLKCGTCDLGVETVSHLFFTCSLVRSLVDLIARWWNVSCVAIDTYAEWVLWIQDLRMPPKNKRMLEGVFYSMWWHVWTFRNKMIFDSKNPRKATLFDDIVSNSYFWIRNRCHSSFSMCDWIKNPSLISL
nr:RNA-directed DNA polymerase, eukaryota [Tanacetum cinerariifolium]